MYQAIVDMMRGHTMMNSLVYPRGKRLGLARPGGGYVDEAYRSMDEMVLGIWRWW